MLPIFHDNNSHHSHYCCPPGGVEVSTSYDHLQLLPLPDTSWVQIESVVGCFVVESFSIPPAACGITVEDSVVE